MKPRNPAFPRLPRAVVVDYGGTIATGQPDAALGERLVDTEAAAALRVLHGRGLRLILASNTVPEQTRWTPMRIAGVAELFAAALLSASLGVAKPSPLFYRLALTAAECPPERVLWVGNNLKHDILPPLALGMSAVLVKPGDPPPDEEPPHGVHVIPVFAELPALLPAARRVTQNGS